MKTTSKPPVLVLTNDDYIYGMEKGYYDDHNKDLKEAGKIIFINKKDALEREKKGEIKNISNLGGEIFIYEPYSDVYLPESHDDTCASFLLNKALTILRILKLMGVHCVLLSDEKTDITDNKYEGDLHIDTSAKRIIERIIERIKKIFGIGTPKENDKEKEEEENKNKDKEENKNKDKEEKGVFEIKAYYEKECKGIIKQKIRYINLKNKPQPIEKVKQELKRTGIIEDPGISSLFTEFCDNGGMLNCSQEIDIELTTELQKALGIIAQADIKAINAKLELVHKKFQSTTIKQKVKVYFDEVNEETIALHEKAKGILE